MPITAIYDPDAYAERVITEFKDDHTGADFETRKKLWKSAVVIYEVSQDPEPWIECLRVAALGNGMRVVDVETTIRSAQRKAVA